jgi:uncharacterized damage-inducible protein DinB
MPPSVSADKLLAWNDTTAQHWRDFINAHPLIVFLPCDIRAGKTVGDTLHHIFAVELRYAQRLASLPESPYEEIPKEPFNSLFQAHRLAVEMVRNLFDDPAYDWSTELTFDTIAHGRLRATREAILVHLTLHSIRHYAQLATLLRQSGHKTTWPMDYLFTAAQRA